MNPLENVWSGLVQRRLLPVVILLVAAIAAIPFVLAKDPEPVAPAVAAADSRATTDSAMADAVVTLAESGEAQARRRVLGAPKNPFEPAAAPKGAATDRGRTISSAPAGGAQAADTQADVGSKAEDSPAPEAPAATEAPAGAVPQTGGEKQHAPTYELYSLTVRFGSADSDSLEKLNLPRLKALPAAVDPILVYLGPSKDAKAAVFMVDEAVEAQGDGVCNPTPRDCETIHMRPGDTEFFDVMGEDGTVTEQYQLDLLKIKTSKTDDAAAAAVARAKASRAGRSVLRAHQAATGPLRYRYDARSGTVRRIPSRAYKALMAKTARIALGTAGGF